jgi:CrcB protein
MASECNQLPGEQMKLLMQYLAIGAAGSLGAMSRYLVGSLCGRLFGSEFPIGTLVINVSGSLFLGWFLTVIREQVNVSDTFRLAVAVGFVGAYTTFSTFAYETNALWEDGAGLKAASNLFGSIFVGLVAVRFGIWLASR